MPEATFEKLIIGLVKAVLQKTYLSFKVSHLSDRRLRDSIQLTKSGSWSVSDDTRALSVPLKKEIRLKQLSFLFLGKKSLVIFNLVRLSTSFVDTDQY